MKKGLLKIDYSPSFKGLSSFLGLPLITIGAFCFAGVSEDVSFLFIAIGLVSIGLLMFLKIKGVVIKYENKTIRTYNDYLIFKTGEWQSIEEYHQVRIYFEKPGFYAGKHRGSSSKINSYEVCLVNSNEKIYILKEFQNFKEAKALMKKVAETLDIVAINEIVRVK